MSLARFSSKNFSNIIFLLISQILFSKFFFNISSSLISLKHCSLILLIMLLSFKSFYAYQFEFSLREELGKIGIETRGLGEGHKFPQRAIQTIEIFPPKFESQISPISLACPPQENTNHAKDCQYILNKSQNVDNKLNEIVMKYRKRIKRSIIICCICYK